LLQERLLNRLQILAVSSTELPSDTAMSVILLYEFQVIPLYEFQVVIWSANNIGTATNHPYCIHHKIQAPYSCNYKYSKNEVKITELLSTVTISELAMKMEQLKFTHHVFRSTTEACILKHLPLTHQHSSGSKIQVPSFTSTM